MNYLGGLFPSMILDLIPRCRRLHNRPHHRIRLNPLARELSRLLSFLLQLVLVKRWPPPLVQVRKLRGLLPVQSIRVLWRRLNQGVTQAPLVARRLCVEPYQHWPLWLHLPVRRYLSEPSSPPRPLRTFLESPEWPRCCVKGLMRLPPFLIRGDSTH